MSPATRAWRASFTSRSERGSSIFGASTGVGSGRCSVAEEAGGRMRMAAFSISSWLAGRRTATSFGTSFSMMRTCLESSSRLASATPATMSCENAVSPNAQQAIGKTGSLAGVGRWVCSEAMGGRCAAVLGLSISREFPG